MSKKQLSKAAIDEDDAGADDGGGADDADGGDVATTPVDTTLLYSAAFTYPFLAGVTTLGVRRPRTVHIPTADLNKMTGMERQYWEIKRRHFDVCVFFKKGKFYELYDCDAVIGNREFGLRMTQDLSNRGKMRMSGVPEQSFSEWARLFVFKGYKVGRVEQMGTGEDAGNQKDKCVPRELVNILTRGTLTDAAMLAGQHEANYVLAVVPSEGDDGATTTTTTPSPRAFLDCVAVDLSRRIYLRCPCTTEDTFVGLLKHLAPRELIIPTGTSAKSPRSATARSGTARSGTEQDDQTGASRDLFLDNIAKIARVVINDIDVNAIDDRESNQAAPLAPLPDDGATEDDRGAMRWPAWRLLAAYFSYLKLPVSQVLPQGVSNPVMGKEGFERYLRHEMDQRQQHDRHDNAFCSSPTVSSPSPSSAATSAAAMERDDEGLAMDAAAVDALELLQNLRDGTSQHTMIEYVTGGGKFLVTPGGKRLFRQWLLRPAADARVIRARQSVVVAFMASSAANLRGVSVRHRSSGTHAVAPSSPPRTPSGATAGGAKMGEQLAALWEKYNSPLAGTSQGDGASQSPRTPQSSSEGGRSPGSPLGGRGGSRHATTSYFLPFHLCDFERLLSRVTEFKNEDTRVVFTDPLVIYPKRREALELLIRGVRTTVEFLTELRDDVLQTAGGGAAAAVSRRPSSALSAVPPDVVGDDEDTDREAKAYLSELFSPWLQPLRQLLEKVSSIYDPPTIGTGRNTLDASNGIVIPRPGQSAAYDDAVATIASTEATLQKILVEYQQKLGCQDLYYSDLGKDLFLLEVPIKFAAQAHLVKSGIRDSELAERARTAKTVKFSMNKWADVIASHKKAITAKGNALVAFLREVASILVGNGFHLIFECASSLAKLDGLSALARSGELQLSLGGSVCVPTLVDLESHGIGIDEKEDPAAASHVSKVTPTKQQQQTQRTGSSCRTQTMPPSAAHDAAPSFVLARGVYHPVVRNLKGVSVPNDIQLGSPPPNTTNEANPPEESSGGADVGRVLVLTGPNMGGKSTLMRTVAVAFIIAQLGGVVCAESFHFRPVTRIFTRIGARDATHKGQSTLHVELTELATIHKVCNQRSLCLIDEPGRGTSTHDGYALAHASLMALLNGPMREGGGGGEGNRGHGWIAPLTLFSTHYHALALEVQEQLREATEEASAAPSAQIGYMDYTTTAPPPSRSEAGALAMASSVTGVTFLYKLVPGVCSRSYGVEVAYKTGIAPHVVEYAKQMSERLQLSSLDLQLATALQSAVALARQSHPPSPPHAAPSDTTRDTVGSKRCRSRQEEVEAEEIERQRQRRSGGGGGVPLTLALVKDLVRRARLLEGLAMKARAEQHSAPPMIM